MVRRAALGLLFVLGLAGCGGDDSGPGIATAGNGTARPSSSASAGALSPQERQLKFAQCMRENGVEDFADPEPGSNPNAVQIRIPPGESRETVDAAMKACRPFLPGGGEPPRLSAEEIEQQRKFSRCMRENGVPNFPDPDANGRLQINSDQLGAGPNDPAFRAAQEACEQYRLQRPGERGPQTNTEGDK